MENFDPFPVLRYKAGRIHDGMRLDRFLRDCMGWRSRASIRRAIEAGRITVDGRPPKPASRIRAGNEVTVQPEPRDLPDFDPDAVPVTVLYEDDHIAVFSKPPGIVVHPTGTHLNNTFMHVMVHRYEGQTLPSGEPVLPCLAHRIDQDTSGVLLLSKDRDLRAALQALFERGEADKAYRAIVHGVPEQDAFTVDLPIGLDETSPIAIKRGIRHDTGAGAVTDVEVVERFPRHALVVARPRTGRTHQIRVHLDAVGHPIIADHMYADELRITRGDLVPGAGDDVVIDRQALHAWRLGIRHPVTGEAMVFEAPDPPDMAAVLALLRGDSGCC